MTPSHRLIEMHESSLDFLAKTIMRWRERVGIAGETFWLNNDFTHDLRLVCLASIGTWLLRHDGDLCEYENACARAEPLDLRLLREAVLLGRRMTTVDACSLGNRLAVSHQRADVSLHAGVTKSVSGSEGQENETFSPGRLSAPLGSMASHLTRDSLDETRKEGDPADDSVRDDGGYVLVRETLARKGDDLSNDGRRHAWETTESVLGKHSATRHEPGLVMTPERVARMTVLGIKVAIQKMQMNELFVSRRSAPVAQQKGNEGTNKRPSLILTVRRVSFMFGLK